VIHRLLVAEPDAAARAALQTRLAEDVQWCDATFVPHGRGALAALARSPFDVVLSEVDLSGDVDGAAVLQEARVRCPRAARLVVSALVDRATLLRVLPVAHQILSKPLDSSVLRGVVERTCNLQELLSASVLGDVVGRLFTLPSAEQSYWALSSSLRRDDIGLAEVAAIVEEDPAMAAKVLQLVNSAYYGLRHDVTSILEAVRVVGLDMLTGLLVGARVFGVFDERPLRGFSVDRLQAHSLAVARATSQLVGQGPASPLAFTTGLLHDVGQLALAVGDPDRWSRVWAEARAARRPIALAEADSFGVSHAEAGAYLLGLWGLPFPVVEAVAYHHRPGGVRGGARDLIAALHVAETVIEYGAGEPGVDLDGEFLASGSWPLATWLSQLSADPARWAPVAQVARRVVVGR
jgi:HD-like signal output (HDOD) protein